MGKSAGYIDDLMRAINETEITDDKGLPVGFQEALDIVLELIGNQASLGKKILFIGNGGSAAIASHMAIDFWRNGGIPALAFNDGALLTCIGNDFGYEKVFEKPMRIFAGSGDILFAISSSGQSDNILLGAKAANSAESKVITLSGFKRDNPLRTLGMLNFYVPSEQYGFVELAHQVILHMLLDFWVSLKSS